MTPHTGTAMARKPTTNITLRPIHCVVSTPVKPSCENHSQSEYRLAKTKNATTSAAITASVMETIRRERFGGVAWFGAEVVVTPSS